jgi:RNA polymerase sigma-70 factor (ECF subfamily)
VQDAELRSRFRQGDPDAVRSLYRSHGRLVFAVAYRILGDRGLAEDATQQTFLKAWRAAQSFDEDRDPAPWLAAIARRVAIDTYRRETVRAADPLDAVPAGDPALVSSPQTADAIYDVWEVRQAVQQLPADEQEVVRLQHFEGLTHAQIAQRTGIAVGTVKSRSFRAHQRLAALLGHLRAENPTG